MIARLIARIVSPEVRRLRGEVRALQAGQARVLADLGRVVGELQTERERLISLTGEEAALQAARRAELHEATTDEEVSA